MGTITREGKGDVYSYDEDDMVEDPYLVQHLAHFGINIQSLEKVIKKSYLIILIRKILIPKQTVAVIFHCFQ